MNLFRISIDTNPIVWEPKIFQPLPTSNQLPSLGVPLLSRRACPPRCWWSRRQRFHVEVSAPLHDRNGSVIIFWAKHGCLPPKKAGKKLENHDQLNQLINSMIFVGTILFSDKARYLLVPCQGMWPSKRMWAEKPVAKPKRSWMRCSGISKTLCRCRFLGWKTPGEINIHQIRWDRIRSDQIRIG